MTLPQEPSNTWSELGILDPPLGSFRKLAVPHFGVLTMRILVFRVLN